MYRDCLPKTAWPPTCLDKDAITAKVAEMIASNAAVTSRWITDKQRRLGTSKACVAVANKNARIVWALIARHESYRRAA